MAKEYIYIVQSSKELSFCKIGKTNDLERRLNEYNNMTGKSKDNIYSYLFCCEVKDMTKIENAVKIEFSHLREDTKKEIYFYNTGLFEKYVNFVKQHKLFTEQILIKEKPATKILKVKIIKKSGSSLKERGLTPKDVMQYAQKIKNDEFYTRLEDVEKEIKQYPKSVWKNKVVFCNCDDAVDTNTKNTSAFAQYFLENFQELGLGKLICTHYSGKVDLFNQGSAGYIFTKDGFTEFGKKEHPRGYTGSFDDPLSIKILDEEADIVCTNPPFSRAPDYWKLIIESGKQFLIISNTTNVKNKSYIQYFADKKVWAGYNRVDKYLNPKREPVEASGHWYTNIPILDRPAYSRLKIMPLKNIPAESKKYDDNKILLFSDGYIPNDYKKKFAVSTRPILNGLLEKGYRYVQDSEYVPYIDGKRKFGMALVKMI